MQLAADRHPQRQRHVDRAAGRRDVGLSARAAVGPHLPEAARHRQAARAPAAEVHRGRARSAPRNTPAASGPAARCSRSSASTMSARSTATISTTCCRCCGTCATPRQGPILVHVVTQKGKGYAPGRGLGRQVSRRRQVRRRHRRAGEGEGQRAGLHQGVRREPDQGGAQGRQDRRHHRRDAVRHRARPVRARNSRSAPSTSASPSSTR